MAERHIVGTVGWEVARAELSEKEKDVLRDAAELALDVLMHCVRDGEGCDDAATRAQAISALKAALLATRT